MDNKFSKSWIKMRMDYDNISRSSVLVDYLNLIPKENDIDLIDLYCGSGNFLIWSFNKNILFKAECEYIGIAYTNVDKDILWVWAWANPQISKNHTLLSRKLLQYGLDINPSNNNIDIFLKSILTNSRMKLSAIELELIISLSLYISKKEGVLKIPINDKGINSVHWFMVHKFIR